MKKQYGQSETMLTYYKYLQIQSVSEVDPVLVVVFCVGHVIQPVCHLFGWYVPIGHNSQLPPTVLYPAVQLPSNRNQ